MLQHLASTVATKGERSTLKSVTTSTTSATSHWQNPITGSHPNCKEARKCLLCARKRKRNWWVSRQSFLQVSPRWVIMQYFSSNYALHLIPFRLPPCFVLYSVTSTCNIPFLTTALWVVRTDLIGEMIEDLETQSSHMTCPKSHSTVTELSLRLSVSPLHHPVYPRSSD